jgi:hypothetical protein
MAQSGANVVFENERIRVLRRQSGPHERDSHESRHDRLIVYLHDGHVIRTENGKQEEIRRSAGDVVWRNRSQHQIENLKGTDHEVIIVELKEGA